MLEPGHDRAGPVAQRVRGQDQGVQVPGAPFEHVPEGLDVLGRDAGETRVP
jgi:hypothetical protein